MAGADSPTIAVFNTSEDTTDLLRTTLEQAGFTVVTALIHAMRDGKVDFAAFMGEHKPQVVVYDIAIPYEAHWRLFEHFRTTPAARDIPFVVTSTNRAHVAKLAGRERHVYEIVGKPYDLDQIVRAVKEAARQRSVYPHDDAAS
jgi:DNA-binding response OmpR family regulator